MRAAYMEAEAAHQHMAFIARVTTAFSSSLDYQSTLANIAYVANSALSDWCVIDMLDDVGGRRVLAAHRDPIKRDLVQSLMQLPSQATQDGPVARVIGSGVAELRPVSSPELLRPKDASELQIELLNKLGSRSHMIVPFLFRGQSLGTITLVSTDSGREYSRDDLRLAVDFAWRSAIALDNAANYHSGRESIAGK
jgi:GAF domain-containing protein